MSDTKEKILLAALHLFAQNGYEAVSVSEIAGCLGMTKGALYKHYPNKRAIFDRIVARMQELDAENAGRFSLPQGTPDEMAEAYRSATLRQLADFSRAQFHYWTAEEFPASFRRMLTLEQFRSAEMGRLYQQYLAAGPLCYVTELFRAWDLPEAETRAVRFYAPMFLAYSLYDGTADKNSVTAAFERHLGQLCSEWETI